MKVDTGKLDYLVEMVGELVIAQSLIQHDPDLAARAQPALRRNLGQLTRITADVQRVAMAMRMIRSASCSNVWHAWCATWRRNPASRSIWSLAGEDTELDRNLVEELADPLMHMIRNAVDHGAEPPEDRIAAGQEAHRPSRAEGVSHGGFINIEISDDGRGLAREKILAKARQRGLVSGGDRLPIRRSSASSSSRASTAAKVTDVSGRGVGMDVVRRQIAKLRGRIDIASRPGHGSTLRSSCPSRWPSSKA